MAQFHLIDFLCDFSWPELQISPAPLRFLLFLHYFHTYKICFPHCMGIKFRIKVALFFERCENHMCICDTSSEIMHFYVDFDSCTLREAYFQQSFLAWIEHSPAPLKFLLFFYYYSYLRNLLSAERGNQILHKKLHYSLKVWKTHMHLRHLELDFMCILGSTLHESRWTFMPFT